MIKKPGILFMIAVFLFLAACSTNSTSGAGIINKAGIEINNISSSIGAVGENTNDIETQSFKYTITVTNNDAQDITVVSINPELSKKFSERVSDKDTEVKVNKTISSGGSLDISGEIIFDANGLSKEQIVGLEPFIENIKIFEERTIDKSF